MSEITEFLQNPDTAFKAFFSVKVDELIAKARSSSLGQEIKRRAILQELKDLANNPLVLIGIAVLFLLSIRR